MRVLISLVSTIGLAALLLGCGGSKKEDTTPAETAAPAPAAEEGGAPAAEEGAEGPAEGDQPKEEAPPAEEGGGGW